MTSTENSEVGAQASTSRRVATISRRTGLALGMAALVTGGVALAGVSPAQAQVAPCTEYAGVWQTNSNGTWTGPGTTSRSPGEINISNSALSTRYIFMSGVHRPRRGMNFTFINQDNAVVRTYPTTASDDGGVVRQEQNVIPYDFTQVGWKVRVYADIRTRCGGDDVPAHVYVGAINTTP